MSTELQQADRAALAGMTVWSGEANGFYVQCITAWPLELFVKPVFWTLPGGAQFQGVALVDDKGKQYAFNGELVW